jgi:hypothetical protein
MFFDVSDQASKKIAFLKMLTPEQKAAIRDYSDSGYRRINEQLRARAITFSIRRKISILISALGELPNFQGDVFRGAAIEEGLLKKYQRVGQVITERAFVSASRSPSKAFSGNVRFYIISKRGKEIAPWSAYPDEEEVLFSPNTGFKVLEYVRDGNEIEIFLEEL